MNNENENKYPPMTVEKMNIKMRQVTKLNKDKLISDKLMDRMITEAKKRFPDLPVADILNDVSMESELQSILQSSPVSAATTSLPRDADLHRSPHTTLPQGMEYRPPLYSGKNEPITPTEELESTLQTIVTAQQRRLSRDAPAVAATLAPSITTTPPSPTSASPPAISDYPPSISVATTALPKVTSSLSVEAKPLTPNRRVLPPITKSPTASANVATSLASKFADDVINKAIAKILSVPVTKAPKNTVSAADNRRSINYFTDFENILTMLKSRHANDEITLAEYERKCMNMFLRFLELPPKPKDEKGMPPKAAPPKTAQAAPPKAVVKVKVHPESTPPPAAPIQPRVNNITSLIPFKNFVVSQEAKSWCERCHSSEIMNISTTDHRYYYAYQGYKTYDCCDHCCCGNFAAYNLHVSINKNPTAPTSDINTNYIIDYYHNNACCMAPMKCFGHQSISIVDHNQAGKKLGTVEEQTWLCVPRFEVIDEYGTVEYYINNQTCCFGYLLNCFTPTFCCCENSFNIYGPWSKGYASSQVGSIKRQPYLAGMQNSYTIEFPEKAEEESKARLLGALFLIQGMAFR